MAGQQGRLFIGAAPKRRVRLGPIARGVLLSLAAGLLLARLFFVQIVQVEGNTMAPNILDGDGLVVFDRDRPGRGDVVLVELGDRAVLRRVLGLPGDRIGTASGVLVRDDLPLPTRVAGVFAWRSATDEGEGRPHRQQQLIEEIGPAQGHAVLGDYVGASRPWALDFATVEVPVGSLFVLCDNRRLCPVDELAGVVPLAAVQGVARSRLWLGDARAKGGAPGAAGAQGLFSPVASGPVAGLDEGPGRK